MKNIVYFAPILIFISCNNTIVKNDDISTSDTKQYKEAENIIDTIIQEAHTSETT